MILKKPKEIVILCPMVNPVIRQNKDFKVCAPTIRHKINNI